MRRLMTAILVGLALMGGFALSPSAKAQGFGADVLFGDSNRGASRQNPEAKPLIQTTEKVGGESFLIRLNIDPRQGIVVGQPVHLNIDVLTPSGFGRAADAPDLDVQDAIIIQTKQSATRISTAEGETRYTGQRWRYLMYPRRAGEFTIPPTEIKVELLERGKVVASAQLTLPDAHFQTTLPEEAAAAGLTSLISTRDLHFAQEIDRKLMGLMVGDAVQRTISMSAPDTTGMLFPPVPEKSVDGISIYPDQPLIQDTATRSGYNGKRVERFTYVFEKEGSYILPEIDLYWWNLEKNRLEKETLDALEIEVAPNPAWVVTGSLLEGEENIEVKRGLVALMIRFLRENWVLLLGVFVLCGILLRLLRTHWGGLANKLATAKQNRANSEVAFFRQFRRACRTDDPKLVLRQLLRWLDRVESGPHPAILAAFTARNADPVLRAEIDRLVEEVCGRDADHTAAKSWTGRKLVASVKHARKKWRKKVRTTMRTCDLPPMNPSSLLES